MLDLTVVNGVLTPISDGLGASAAAAHWVIGAYAVAFGGFLLVGGRTADLLGPRRMFAAGSAAFALTSLACAATPSMDLIAARGGQGLSAAFLEPAAVALLASLYPAGDGRVRALAIWGSVGSLGAISGSGPDLAFAPHSPPPPSCSRASPLAAAPPPVRLA